MLYDNSDEYSILRHGKKIEGKSLNWFMNNVTSENEYIKESSSANNSGKGSLGQLVEEVVFEYKINSDQASDFEKVGMELKVVPLKKVSINNKTLAKKQGLSVKERISLTQIDYEKLVTEEWENNSLNKKLLKLLLMFYIHEKGIDKLDLNFRLVEKWEPSENDLKVIKDDWHTILNKVKKGLAHELSEGDTLYLGAATKGNSSKSMRKQPFNTELAKQRAFSLKRNFVESIFEELLHREKNKAVEKELPITIVIENILNKYKGMTVEDIMNSTGIEKSNAKHWLRLFCNKLIEQELGEKFSKSNSIKKSGVELKTICLQVNGVPKESMSFEQINFEEIVDEKWEESGIREKFELMKHLWVVFKASKRYSKQNELALDEIVLDSIYLWNMPMSDLEGEYKTLWEDTVRKIDNNEFDKFMKSADNKVGHIRPKATNSKDKATFRGQKVPKKSFWLNANYVAEQIVKMKNQI
jgi:DNA mismatch repair protein MutH